MWLPEKQYPEGEHREQPSLPSPPQFRIPKSIHPYSSGMASMYLAQHLNGGGSSFRTAPAEGSSINDDDDLSVAPRAFQLDDLPSTPQLNGIMDR